MNVWGTVTTTSPGLNAGSHQSETHSIGAACKAHTMFAAAKTGEIPFESLNQRTAHESGRPQNRLDHRNQFRLKLLMHRHEIKKRGLVLRIRHVGFSHSCVM